MNGKVFNVQLLAKSAVEDSDTVCRIKAWNDDIREHSENRKKRQCSNEQSLQHQAETVTIK